MHPRATSIVESWMTHGARARRDQSSRGEQLRLLGQNPASRDHNKPAWRVAPTSVSTDFRTMAGERTCH